MSDNKSVESGSVQANSQAQDSVESSTAAAVSTSSANTTASATASTASSSSASSSSLNIEDYPDECCLFVGDLSRSALEDDLRRAFSQFGEVLQVDIKRDRQTNNSLGYGFVQFRTKSQAADAKKNLNKQAIAGRPIRLGWAQKNTNLFVGDLDQSVTTDLLREIFRKFGDIVEKETVVKNKNYGFVKYKHRGDAERAKREMDGKEVNGRPIRIGWGDANPQRNCVHLQFNLEQAPNVNEEQIRTTFEKFGQVVSINFPRTPQGTYKGFGFVRFANDHEGQEAAANAISSLTNGLAVEGLTLQCNFGKKPHQKNRRIRKQRFNGNMGNIGRRPIRPFVSQQMMYAPVPQQAMTQSQNTQALTSVSNNSNSSASNSSGSQNTSSNSQSSGTSSSSSSGSSPNNIGQSNLNMRNQNRGGKGRNNRQQSGRPNHYHNGSQQNSPRQQSQHQQMQHQGHQQGQQNQQGQQSHHHQGNQQHHHHQGNQQQSQQQFAYYYVPGANGAYYYPFYFPNAGQSMPTRDSPQFHSSSMYSQYSRQYDRNSTGNYQSSGAKDDAQRSSSSKDASSPGVQASN